MNEEIMLDEVQEVPQEGRPVFITVLCILTWIGSGFTFLSSIYNMFTLKASQEILKQSNINFGDLASELPEGGDAGDRFARSMAQGMGNSFDAMIEWGATLNFVSMGVSLACILGALLMFKLKKAGFFIYTIATIISIVVPVVLLGGNIFTIFSTVLGGIFGVLFIILYGVNLKHMKN